MMFFQGNTYLEPGSEGVFIAAFAFVILAVLLWAMNSFCTEKETRCYKFFGQFFSFLCMHIPAFYFLLRCVTHNFGAGATHEDRAGDFGIAGLCWAVAMFFLVSSLRTLKKRLNSKNRKD